MIAETRNAREAAARTEVERAKRAWDLAEHTLKSTQRAEEDAAAVAAADRRATAAVRNTYLGRLEIGQHALAAAQLVVKRWEKEIAGITAELQALEGSQ